MVDNPTLYPHRRNADGSYDSICTTCFATVARSPAEVGLTEGERAHVRSSSFLADRGNLPRTS
jgi:hypothetical protein